MIMDYEKISKEVISKQAGLEVEEITDASFFEDDLNIGEMELIEILGEIEEKFQIDLSEERESFETFGDLIGALNEKLE